jgi:hypothetical protein
MPKKIYKELINYSCPECLKSFGNRKDYYERHTNRKNPCVKIPPPIPPIPPIPSLTPPNLLQNVEKIPLCIEVNKIKKNKNNKVLEKELDNELENESENELEQTKNELDYCCEYCNKTFSKKYNLTRHQNGRCKQKPNKILIDKTNTNTKSNEEINLILERLKNLENENEKLKKEIKKNKSKSKSHVNISQSNYNINVVNNNNNNNIINFNDMNYNKIDKKLFIGPILDRKLFGKAIILKMIENIYINESLPEYQNLVITDKNRGYVKVFNNGKWKTDNLNIINLVLNGIVEHSKSILDELYDIYLNNNQATNRLNTSEKYINLCDNEYLEDLKDAQENEQADNKNEIKRCEDFREMIFKDTINLFHDNKNILLKPKKNISLIDL